MNPIHRRHLAALATGTIALTVVSGCGANSPLSKNKGGDTPCSDYMEMAPEVQREVITTFL